MVDADDSIGDADTPQDQLAAVLVDSAGAATRRLSSIELEPTTEGLRRIIASELEQRADRDLGSYVRADRSPWGRHGAWRFSLLIEAPDRVLAAIEVSSAPDAIEHEVLALARLSAGIERGVAERGFLFSASHKGRGLTASSDRAQASPQRHVELPFAHFFHWHGTPWQLVVIEADQETHGSAQ